MTPLEIAFEKGNPHIIQLLSNADIPDSVFDEVQHIDDDNVFEFVKDITAPDGKIDSKLQSKIMKDPHGDNNNAGSNQRSKVPHTKKKNKKKKDEREHRLVSCHPALDQCSSAAVQCRHGSQRMSQDNACPIQHVGLIGARQRAVVLRDIGGRIRGRLSRIPVRNK
ncbi:uncharacterized protein LOC102809324 [Saccoglossus kowalevskii]